jgi:hypothetical protein
MDFQHGKTYRMPNGELVMPQGREMGWHQLGNESHTWTVAPDGTVYEGMLAEGVTHPYSATGQATGGTPTKLPRSSSTNTFRISDEAASVAYFRAPTLKDCRQEPPHGIHDTRD